MHTFDAELNHPHAHCALWWMNTPVDPDGGGRIGCVGKFECADKEVGAALLLEACRRLADERLPPGGGRNLLLA